MRAAPAPSPARVVFLGGVAFLRHVLLLVRLVDLQVLRHEEFARRAQRQQQRTLDITPKRGVLYDRHRRELAVSVAVESVFAIPSEVTDPALAAELLAPVLELDPTALEDRLRSERSFVWLKRKLDAVTAERVKELNLAGVYFQREHKRYYPKRELAAHVLGFVGVDENGLAGLEYQYEDLIRGPSQRVVVGADGRRRLFHRRNDAPLEGASLVLTLDEKIQYIAERELAAAIEKTRSRSGSIIIQDPATGEILALANHPTFNPNQPAALPPDTHVNRAITYAYEPGSTFKVVTVAAALEEDVTWPEEVIDCQQGAIYIVGHRIRDHKPFGHLSLREVMYESSDVGAIKVGLRIGNEKMHDAIGRWGFGRPTGVGLPAESPGLLRPASRWSRISIGAVSMGQEVGVTSLQLVAAFSAIANGGFRVQPRLVKEILRPAGEETVAPPRPERIIRAEVAEELRHMLAGVVTQGTGVAARPNGYSAAGKTGTAQKIDESGTYSRTDFIASFIGFAPLDKPVVTVLVMLDSPRGALYHGGEVAAPVFRSVVERVLPYLNVPRDLPLLPERARPTLQRAAVRDFLPGQFDLSGWPQGEAAGAAPARAEPGAVSVAGPPKNSKGSGKVIVLEGEESVVVPDFTGMPLRRVGEQCSQLALEPVLLGSGLAVAQRPTPGTRLPRGSRVWVEFRPQLPRAPARPM